MQGRGCVAESSIWQDAPLGSLGPPPVVKSGPAPANRFAQDQGSEVLGIHAKAFRFNSVFIALLHIPLLWSS